MSRITKSKIYKPFISLLVAVLLVFSYEVNRPKAIVPIVIWGAGILAGVVAEELLEMGIKHVTADGKTTKKSKTGKVVDAVLDNLDGYDFDNTNPTRKADGSLEVNLSANDRAKIARHIADEFGDVIEGEEDDMEDMTYPRYSTTSSDTADPFYNTSLNVMFVSANVSTSHQALEFTKRYFAVKFEPQPYLKKTKVTVFSRVTGKVLNEMTLDGSVTGQNYQFRQVSYVAVGDDTNACLTTEVLKETTYSTYYRGYCDMQTVRLYTAYLDAMRLANAKIHTFGGLSVPSTLKQVYKIGEAYDGDELPNRQELSNKPYKIPNFFPPSESDSDVEWEIVQNHYDNDVTNTQTKIDNEYETYLENGDLNQNTYNTQTINNYYTDTNYPVKSDDANLIINIDIDLPPATVVDGDDGGVSDGESAPVIDRTLISYAKQTYDYLGDSIDGAITSMRDITDDASGLVDYLDTSFRWLPAEWRALFGSAFILGVFAHFMRR